MITVKAWWELDDDEEEVWDYMVIYLFGIPIYRRVTQCPETKERG